jgi:hypothetical protein
MISNLRSKPIEGHITDSAGNVLRNSTIVIKRPSYNDVSPVDSVISDDDGYFQSKPLPSGSYDIYESNIKISRLNHIADPISIQCIRANKDNYNHLSMDSFSNLAKIHKLNNYRHFIQIEGDHINTNQYGNSFPIYDIDISTNPDSAGSIENYSLASFFKLTSNSRITTTKFDVEYFSPITASSHSYKRVRWAGVPAIKFGQDSKLVLPLDYFSIVANMPKKSISANMVISYWNQNSGIVNIRESYESAELRSFINSVSIGDIIKLELGRSADQSYSKIWYGIFCDSNKSNAWSLNLEKWLSSRFQGNVDFESYNDIYVKKLYLYDGVFQNMSEINDEVGSRFTVVENVYAQDFESNIYNYNNRYVS